MGRARGQGWRLAASAFALLAVLAMPAGAAGKAGRLDRGFSGDGKVLTVFPEPERPRAYPKYAVPFEFAPGRIAMAGGRGGRLVAASSDAIVRYLANGRRDPRFGGNGAVPIEQIDGFRFQLADVAVDSKGRVLIAGTTKTTGNRGLEGVREPGPLPSIATIRRYKPNGEPDSGFGAGGVLHAFFGVPPATFEGKSYPEPAVSLIGLAVDGSDRVIVSGSFVAEVGHCGPSRTRFERSHAFVVRLLADGRPDPSFAGGATRAFGEVSWLSSPTPGPSGFFAVGIAEEPPCRSGAPDAPSIVVGFGDNGPGPPFGGDGFWARPFTRVSDIAVAPGGKVVLLVRKIELVRGNWVESAGRVVLLRPNGSYDRRFGRRGVAMVRPPRRGSLVAIAVDRRGRVLVAGTVKRKPWRKQGGRRSRRGRANVRFLLIRTTRKGRMDRGFGRRGQVATGFGARTYVRATDVLVDRANRISVGGKFSGFATFNAFAIARYRGGR